MEKSTVSGSTGMMEKSIKDWTLEDCDSKEYWKFLFQKSKYFKLLALNGKLRGDQNGIKTVTEWVEGNELVAHKMLCDLIKHDYLTGGVKDGKFLYGTPMWVQGTA